MEVHSIKNGCSFGNSEKLAQRIKRINSPIKIVHGKYRGCDVVSVLQNGILRKQKWTTSLKDGTRITTKGVFDDFGKLKGVIREFFHPKNGLSKAVEVVNLSVPTGTNPVIKRTSFGKPI